MKRCGSSNRDWLWAFVLILLMPIWVGLAPKWYSWFAVEKNGLWMKWLYDLLDGLAFVNIPISVGITSLTYCWNARIWKDNDCRPYRFVLPLIVLMLLYWDNNVIYANIIYGFDYRILLSCFSIMTLLVLTFKLLKVVIHKSSSKNEVDGSVKNRRKSQGFSHDRPKEQNIPDSLRKYASIIAGRLMATEISNQSYAIGITGEWGVGKTTFLNLLKNELAKEAEIVEFNPWMCRSPEQLTNDFFASLRHQLSPKYSTLSKSIKEYAKSINNLTLTPHNVLGLELSVPIREESLYEKKKSLSERFSCLSRPVVVVIDDLDRLERDEVFEVLRLIRNTADLNHTIYLVAYDKEYVTSVLEEKNIRDAASYLEKIFPVEIHLPKVGDYLIWETLHEDLSCQDKFGGAFTESLFARLGSDERALILKVLNNYRRAKRFARLYMLNFDYIMEQCNGEIKLLDLFWLELLQVYDKKVYDKLANEPFCLLYYEKGRFNLKNGILPSSTENEKNMYKEAKFWQDETPKILERIFGNCIKTRKESICYSENYDKYFMLSVSPYRLSFKDLKELLTEGGNPEEIVNHWVDSGKYFSSIVYQLGHVEIQGLSDNLLKNYLYGLLFFALKIVSYRSCQIVDIKILLLSDRYEKAGKKEIAHDNIRTWFDNKIGNNGNLLHLSGLLNLLYQTNTYRQGYEENSLSLVISNKEIEELLILGMKTYLGNHPESTALDLIVEKSELFKLFRNCCLHIVSNIDEGYDSYKQVAFKIVTDYFAQKEIKPDVREYEALHSSLYSQEPPVFANFQDENDYWNYIEEEMEYKMRSSFGNSYDSDLKEFKRKCFVIES